MPGIGQVLPVSIRLRAEDSGRIVRSTVRDKDGIEISGSPFTLSHVSEGLFSTLLATMPDSDFVTVAHDIFKGPGFSNRDPVYFGNDSQCFTKDSFEDAVDAIKDAIRGFDLVAEIDDGGILVATIFDDTRLTATVDDNLLTATIDVPDKLEAVVDSGDTLEGDIEC